MYDFIQDNMVIVRNILKYSQADLACVLGVSRAHISQLESGKIKLSRTVAIAFLTLVIFKFDKLDNEEIDSKLLKVYIGDFKLILSNILN